MAEIEFVEKLEKRQRDRLWDMYQKWIEDLESDLDNLQKNPFNMTSAVRVMSIGRHIFGQLDRETSLSILEYVREHRLKDLTHAHSADWKQISLIAAQFIGALAGAALGTAPHILGKTGSAAQAIQSVSHGINSIVVDGSKGVGNFVDSAKAGERAVIQAELQEDNSNRQDREHKRNQELQAKQRNDEMIATADQYNHRAIEQMANG